MMNEPALLELFYSLQELGFPLGIESYYSLIESLSGGFGTKDRDSLARLCCTLWVKTEEEKQLFQKKFDQLISKKDYDRLFNSETTNRLEKSSFTLANNSSAKKSNQKKLQTVKYLFYLVSLILFVGLGIRYCKKSTLLPKSPGSLVFSKPLGQSQFAVREGKTTKIPIVRVDGNKGTLTGSIKVNSGASSSATIDEDFKLLSTKVDFKNGDTTTKDIQISINNDDSFEYKETINLQLFTIQNGVEKQTDTIEIVIIDDTNSPIDLPPQFKQALILLALTVLVIFAFLIYRAIIKDDSTRENNQSPNVLPIDKLSTEVVQNMFDRIQVNKAFKQPVDLANENYLINTNFLPVTYRQIKQSLRCLRSNVREGVPIDLDLEQTIAQIGQNGFLLAPVLQPRSVNKTEFLLLIDRDGSMVPFHHISQALIDAASKGGRFKQMKVFYFHNCPGDYLYSDPYRLESNFIEDCLTEFANRRIVCLIFSDAGAARGQFSSKRRRETKFFLKELKRSVNKVAWLNPVPRNRWENTTAEDIAELIPMYEFSPKEVYLAVETLRGRGRKTTPSANI